MASSGLRRAYGLAALMANVHLAVSQTTAASDVVGFVMDDNTISTSVTCELNNYQIYMNNDPEGPFLFCDATTDYWMGTACAGDSTLLYVTTADLSSARENTYTCASACTSLTVVQEFPSGGSTWMIYDCDEFMRVPSGVDVVYETLPASVDTISTTAESSTETETSSADGTRGTNSSPEETDSFLGGDDDRDDSSSSDSGPNVPVIVGATVGSVAGVALIIAAIFIGIRIGKKRAAAKAGAGPGAAAAGAGAVGGSPGGMVPPQPQMVWQPQPGVDPSQYQGQVPPPMTTSPPLDKYGGPPVVMASPGHPSQYTQSYYQPPPQQQPPQGYYPPQGYHRPEQYSPQPSQPSQPSTGPAGGPPELPTGASAQGWASSEDHPHPYEMEAMLQPDQRNSPRPH